MRDNVTAKYEVGFYGVIYKIEVNTAVKRMNLRKVVSTYAIWYCY